ncbi:MAG: hypothetical protein QOK25_1502 [Thermoleophilaceae bacterium]|nr:hypothetical protein [Thermoleophilaceae bacterium]
MTGIVDTQEASTREVDRETARLRRARRRLLVAGNFTLWGLIPNVWLVGAWAVGPKLDHAHMPWLTPLLFMLLLTGMPATMYGFAKILFRAEARLAARAGVQSAFRLRSSRSRPTAQPSTGASETAPRPPLSQGRRAASLGISLTMFAASLGLWAGVPVGWIWIASQLSGTTAPAAWPYLLIVAGILLTALVGAKLLASLARLHATVSGAQTGGPGPPSWRRSFRDASGGGAGSSGLDRVMVMSVVMAVLVFTVWLFFFADPSGLLPPELQSK